jgi:predicted site-specific integrase-resolvase
MSEENEFMTLKEAAEHVGIKRASLYFYLEKLEIKPLKFENNKNAFIARTDVERIKQMREQPWKVSKEKAVA